MSTDRRRTGDEAKPAKRRAKSQKAPAASAKAGSAVSAGSATPVKQGVKPKEEPAASARQGQADAAHYAFVEAVLGGIDAAQRISLYGPLLKVWSRKENTNRRRAQVAPAYVIGWLLFDALLLFASPLWIGSEVASIVCAAIAGYRFLDIVLFQLEVMLSRKPEHKVFAAFERSLILLALNVVELTLISGVWLRAAGLGGTTASWFAGFLLTTLMGTPDKPSGYGVTAGTETDIATVATICGALLLLVGGVGLLIGLLSQKFREYPGE
ncbi:MAG TPA: hypothetical protein VHW67_05465 [Solirubrobacteraceae bacterium]|jgi:hypothetical protein|nr:hypothetical protein [Solirubrobacteraceae bacterium]